MPIYPLPGQEDEWSRLGDLVETWQTIAGEALTDKETNAAFVALSDVASVRAAIDYIDIDLKQDQDSQAELGSRPVYWSKLMEWARRGLTDLAEQLDAAAHTAPHPDTTTREGGSLLWQRTPPGHRQWTAADAHLGHMIIEHDNGDLTLHTAAMDPGGALYPAVRCDSFTVAATAAQHRSAQAAKDTNSTRPAHPEEPS